ncbi:hypothetical protein F0U44_06650 [Nocardioides humilatus]|uniref:Uncharacterized protein n=1 Tax=Nocardioides humilatus TaxID=2607660 RepID=A0A5B1LQQ2_9ACTN|nr:hypothetical protein [Nocardioides humilatus]KAA1421937.1 hypothetical protein F0U44_06650 [Nocardioides humilatus]
MRAPLRTWGASRIGLAVVLTVLWIETTATDQITIPPFTHDLNGWCFVPTLTAIALAEPLIDRSPQLTELGVRSPLLLALARLALVWTGGAAVVGYCWWSGDLGRWAAPYVLLFLAFATAVVAALSSWYWLPLLPLVFVWLQVSASGFPGPDFAIPRWQVATAVAAAWLAYAVSIAVRDAAQRRQ